MENIQNLEKQAKKLIAENAGNDEIAEVLYKLTNPDLYTSKEDALKYKDQALIYAKQSTNKLLIYLVKANELRVYHYLTKLNKGEEIIQFFKEEIHNFKNDIYTLSLISNAVAAFYNQLGYYQKALDIYNWLNDEDIAIMNGNFLANMYNCKAVAYQRKNEIENAFKNFNKALQIHEKGNNKKGQAQIYYNLSMIYDTYFDNVEKGKELLKKSLKLNKELGRKYGEYICLISLFDLSIRNNEFKKADKLLIDAEALAMLINKEYLNEVYLKYSDLYFKLEEYNKSLKYLNKVNFDEIEDAYLPEVVYYQARRAQCLFKTGKTNEAELKYIEAEQNIMRLEYPSQKLSVIKEIYLFYKQTENPSKALHYLEKYNELNEKFLTVQKNEAVAKYQTKFETAEKEKEIQELKLEKTTLTLQFLRAQMNPHFVFNAINSINSYINPQTTEKAKSLLQGFARLMRANLNFADEDYINLDEEIQFLQDYLNLEQVRANYTFTFFIETDENMDIDFIEIPSMLIQPLVENCIKHGIKNKENGVIKIKFIEEKEFLIVEVEDNGVGREVAAKKILARGYKSKSTSVNNRRLQLINSYKKSKVEINYQDIKNKDGQACGTIATIKIPIE
ncbi:MAG: histidine kinase [Chitinophagales bacterium]